MKKKCIKIAVIFALLVFGSQAFAEKTLAFDFGPGFSNYSCDDKSAGVNDNHLGFTFLKTTQSNLAWKIHAEYQSVLPSSMFPKDDTGNGFSLTFGLGGVLLKNEKMAFTFMPIIGLEFIKGGHLESEIEGVNTKIGGNAIGFRTGADFTGIFRLTKHVGIFTNLGLYYTVGNYEYKVGTEIKNGTTYESQGDDVSSYTFKGLTFAPSIGVSLTFGK